MNKLHFICRSFSLCYVVRGKSYVKEARIMNRFIGATSKKRSWYPAKDVSAASLPHIIQPKRGERSTRRMSVLNKLFMKYISDLLATGELNPVTNHLGIEVSKVEISPDFSILKVYWVAKGTTTDDEVESVLTSNSGKLRHELIQLRVIGNVPSIMFVKDKSMSKVAEVDAVLAKADFGDDFVPSDPSFSLLSNLTLSTKLPKHIEEKILQDDGGLPEIPVPSMQSGALGLEHDVIMQKVKLSMKKAKAPHRSQIAAHSGNAGLTSDEMPPIRLRSDETTEGTNTGIYVPNSEFKKFFAKRLALQSKAVMQPKNYEPGKEMLMHEENLEDDEDEDFDDIDVLADAERIKELQICVDDFTELEEGFETQLYDDRNEK